MNTLPQNQWWLLGNRQTTMFLRFSYGIKPPLVQFSAPARLYSSGLIVGNACIASVTWDYPGLAT
jgi:hypothetical protein